MIPTIEQICDDLKAGTISLTQAIEWLQAHQDLADSQPENNDTGEY